MKCNTVFLAVTASVLILLNTTASAQKTARIEAERLFVEAQKALSRDDNKTAETLLMQSLQKDDSFTSAIWQLSQIYEKRGQLEYARQLILRGLQQEPNASWAREKLAQLEKILTHNLLSEAEDLMSSGDYKLAIPKLSLYMGIKPYDPVPLIQLGRCHLALGNLKVSKEYLVQAFERDPSNGQIAVLLDEVDERLGKTSTNALLGRAREILADYSPDKKEEARDALKAILEKEPDNHWALEKLGELDLLTGEETANDEKNQTMEKGIETVKTLQKPISRFHGFFNSNLFIIISIVIAALLLIDIKRRSIQKSYPLQGSFSLIPILDIVSLLNSNLKTGRLLVSLDDSKGEIFFEKGEVIHARWKSSDGKKAFHNLMDLKTGRYFFFNHLPNIRHTISEPLSLLLLSMKSHDEAPTSKNGRRNRNKNYTPVP